MTQEQLSLWDYRSDAAIDALWEPRDIWLNLSEERIPRFAEDRRVEYKSVKRINFSGLSEYYSMYSNTSAGGVIVYGVADNGTIEGCSDLPTHKLNELEKLHIQLCPLARPEFKRVPVRGGQDFIVAVFLPCTGQLVENHKGRSYIRYGDSKHEMTAEEKQDFRSTRHQRTWETEIAGLNYPDDFDPESIAAICNGYRKREAKDEWSDEEVLVDRLLLCKSRGGHQPTNALVLLAAFSPRLSIPGARVKLQRFKGKVQGEGETFAPIRDTYMMVASKQRKNTRSTLGSRRLSTLLCIDRIASQVRR